MPRWFVCFKFKSVKNTDIGLIQTSPKKTNCGFLPVKKFLIDFYAKLSGDDTTKKSKKICCHGFLEFSANKQVKAIEKVFLYNTVSLKKNLFA